MSPHKTTVGIYDHTGRLLQAAQALTDAGFSVNFEDRFPALAQYDIALVHPAPRDTPEFQAFVRKARLPVFMYDGPARPLPSLAVDGVTHVEGSLSDLVREVKTVAGTAYSARRRTQI